MTNRCAISALRRNAAIFSINRQCQSIAALQRNAETAKQFLNATNI
jgi:hypothetical protein